MKNVRKLTEIAEGGNGKPVFHAHYLFPRIYYFFNASLAICEIRFNKIISTKLNRHASARRVSAELSAIIISCAEVSDEEQKGRRITGSNPIKWQQEFIKRD